MTGLTMVSEMIDLRSFSNLWFWIMLAAAWLAASRRIIGVPFDMITRAQRDRGKALDDLIAVTKANVNRILYLADMAGIAMIAAMCFLLTFLVGIGFFYHVEFAQAVFFVLLPMLAVWWMGVRTARRIRIGNWEGEEGEAALFLLLKRHRLRIHILGATAIVATGVWGTHWNMSQSVLFN
ncbi:MAG: component of SufBCD complex [Pseudomonadota bacterium]